MNHRAQMSSGSELPSRPVVSALAAAILFGTLQFLLVVIASAVSSTNTSVIVRFVGEADGQQYYTVLAENNLFGHSGNIDVSAFGYAAPRVTSIAGNKNISIARGGRGGESVVRIGSLRPGERSSLVLAFPASMPPPTFSTYEFARLRFFGDRDSLASLRLSTIALNTLPMSLVFACFYYFDHRRRREMIASAVESAERTLALERDALRSQTDDLKAKLEGNGETLNEVKADLRNFRKMHARGRLIYERRIQLLVAENSFWRRILGNVLSLAGVSRDQAQHAIRGILEKAKLQVAPSKSLTDGEFLDFMDAMELELSFPRKPPPQDDDSTSAEPTAAP